MLDLLGFRASEKPKLHTYPIHGSELAEITV
jgi:hypothetical protein